MPDNRGCIIYALVIVAFLLGCCGFGFCSPTYNPANSYDSLSAYGSSSSYESSASAPRPALSLHDSLIQEMAEFLQPNIRLPKKIQKHIENRIGHFPHKILRRDTTTYFLQTAYAVAYYEFYKHDYNTGLKYVREFGQKALKPDSFDYWLKFSSVTWSASVSMTDRHTIESQRDKNSWLTLNTWTSVDSIINKPRSIDSFLCQIINDIPIECNISTFSKVLRLFQNQGGKLHELNAYIGENLFQKCTDHGRSDIMDLIYIIWNVTESDFEINPKYNTLQYIHRVDPNTQSATTSLKDTKFIFGLEANIAAVDSLISIKENPSLHIKNVLYLYAVRKQYHLLTEFCKRYESYVDSHYAMTFHNYWALGCSALGRYDEALLHYDTALQYHTYPSYLSTVKLNKALTLSEMGRTEEAVELFMGEEEKLTTPFEKFCWNDNLGYIYSFNNPETALDYYSKAEQYLDKSSIFNDRKVRHFCRKARVQLSNNNLRRLAIDHAMNIIGSDYSARGMAYTELGAFNHDSFNFEEADANFKIAYESYEKLSADDSNMYDLNLCYAKNLCSLGKTKEAVKILSDQLSRQDSITGKYTAGNLRTLRGLINALCQDRDTTNLRNLYTRYKTLSGSLKVPVLPYDEVILQTNYLLALGKNSHAIKVLKNALSLQTTALQTIDIIQRLEELTRTEYGTESYIQFTDSLITPLKQNIVKSLLVLTDNERKSIQFPLQQIIDGLIEGENIIGALSLTLFRKGLLFTTKNSIEKRLSRSPETSNDFRELINMRIKLNDIIAFGDTARIPQTRLSIARMERKLNLKLATDTNLFHQIDRTIDHVKLKLKYGELALDFARFHNGGQTLYGAFVIKSKDNPEFITIGTESDIIKNPGIIWKRLSSHTSAGGDIYFCTDGILNSTGIEFLADADGNPINSKHKLHRLFHLSEINGNSYVENEVVAIGVSDHNSPLGEGETLYRGSLSDLPNVMHEMTVIKNTLCHLNPHIIFNDEALEENIKHLNSEKTSVLHFSTHGFYRDEKQLQTAAANPQSVDYNIARRFLRADKTSLSGLVLRRGNISWKIPEILDEEDDILTADEIENMNFTNLQLTVLSACNTGLGDNDSEGAWGMQRAFRIAGTRTLLCTLREIPDYETTLFMEAFYGEAAKGKSVYDAFRAAQKVLYEEYPDEPEIYTAFILIE